MHKCFLRHLFINIYCKSIFSPFLMSNTVSLVTWNCLFTWSLAIVVHWGRRDGDHPGSRTGAWLLHSFNFVYGLKHQTKHFPHFAQCWTFNYVSEWQCSVLYSNQLPVCVAVSDTILTYFHRTLNHRIPAIFGWCCITSLPVPDMPPSHCYFSKGRRFSPWIPEVSLAGQEWWLSCEGLDHMYVVVELMYFLSHLGEGGCHQC